MDKNLSSQTLKMAVESLEKLGLDANPILSDARISRQKLANPIARIPIKNELAFWQLLLEKTGDPQISLRMAQNVPFGTFALLEYIGASCESLSQALFFLTKYAAVVYGNWYPTLNEADSSITFDLGSAGEIEPSRFTSEFGLAMIIRRLGEFSNQGTGLQKVSFRHKLLGDIKPYETFFGVPVLFEQQTDCLIFHNKIKTSACKNSNHFLLGSLLALGETLLKALPEKKDPTKNPLVLNLRTAIRERLPEGEPEIKAMAKHLAVSTRTLQRKLEADGTSFTELITEERKALAVQLLKTASLTHEEIGLRLGYSTLSAFNRAFKQWFQMTPSDYKKTIPNP
ncbi:MAG: AraC family transcriptional regulator [Bdellovibrionales bacterium]|nr:AraC family transcriptional regulator [Bdellovibrionales bacterium]